MGCKPSSSSRHNDDNGVETPENNLATTNVANSSGVPDVDGSFDIRTDTDKSDTNNKENDESTVSDTGTNSNVNGPSDLPVPELTQTLGKVPVIITYPARGRPRQPFMNQPTNQRPTQPPIQPINQQNNPPARPPTPPNYYTSEVTQNQHQPEQLRRLSRRGTSEETESPYPTQEVQLPNMQPYQPGQIAVMPNNLLNLAYWAPYPENIPPNIPACLAHLIAADSLFIIQQVDIIELFINVEEPNFYLIQNKNGQCIYYAYETSDICAQICCRHSRGFQLHIMDMYHNEIIYMNRPCGCSDYFCCYPVMEVYSPPLTPVGAVVKIFHPTHDEFKIIDPDENKIFKIHGPCCLRTCGCCIEAEFTIHALDGNETEVGIIRREWGGFVRTLYTNADYYGITFPVDLDVRVKAIFLGALFLISLKRTGWVLRNVEDPESVSGHMYRMSVMAFLIPESSGVDKTRCMKLSIVHDLAECIVGDLTPFCGVEPSEKHRQEDAAMKELTQMIGDSGIEIYKLYKEYEAQDTDESKFVKDLDRLDMILQAYEYEKIGNRPGKLEEFFKSTLNKFHFPWTIDIVKEICRQRNLFINKDKV